MARNFRGGAGFTRPENALKRAEELENVGQKPAALQVLHDLICSKKHRTWSKVYESILFKHLDLCVDMKKRNYAKEALMQYRNMCHQVNINSLEEVIKYFLKKAGDRAEEAQQKAASVIQQVEDLEEEASPEDLMLSYVSGEKGKDRTDRELVTPWFRFLWESYRSVLEILRTNPKLEPLYAMTAHKAFAFCLQYKRNAEFKRLCDILRQHLTNMTNRYRDNREGQAESMQLHMETRFEQLKVACELELWAEAFRSIEDIQAIIALNNKKSPKQQMMATYYARLTQIFAVSDAHLYHAYAWLKLYGFSKSYSRGLTQTDVTQMANSVLLSMLSVLPYDRTGEPGKPDSDASAEQDKERTLRMANILGFPVDPKRGDVRQIISRHALAASVQAANLTAVVAPEVRALHELLTSDYSPLELCARLAPVLERLSATPSATLSAASSVKEVAVGQYVPMLKQVAVLRLLKQLSEVYSTLKISSLATLVPFAPFSEVEAIIVDAVRFDYLQIRIDHRNGTLHFGAQQLESDRVRAHLTTLAKRLSKAVAMIAPGPDPELAKRRTVAIEAALEKAQHEHHRALARKVLIEARKEEAEKQLLEAEKEAELRKRAAAREVELAEEKRRREEMLRREKERLEKELEEKEMEEARQMLEASRKGKPGAALPRKDGEKLDKKTLMQEAMSERLKEQQDLERKVAKMGRQMDHLERARREEEAPFIMAAYEARVAEDRAHHERTQAAFLASHRAAWEVDIVEKKRLLPMIEGRDAVKAVIMERREGEFQALRRERERKMAALRAQRQVEREIARRKEYVRRCREDVAAKVEELEEKQARELEERKMAEEAERQRKLDELAEKQRQKEQEIEERKAAERAALLGASAAASAAPAAIRPSGTGYVPPSARRAEATATSSSDAPRREAPDSGWRAPAPPAAAAAPERAAAPAASEDRWGRREAPPPRDLPPPSASRDEDRWGRRDGPPPADRDRDFRRDGPSAAPARDGPAPSAAPTSSTGGRFVPSALRRGAGEAPPADVGRSRDAAPPPSSTTTTRDTAPPPSSGGGSYRPPNRR